MSWRRHLRLRAAISEFGAARSALQQAMHAYAVQTYHAEQCVMDCYRELHSGSF